MMSNSVNPVSNNHTIDNVFKYITHQLIACSNTRRVIITKSNNDSIQLGKHFKKVFNEVPNWLRPKIDSDLSTHKVFSCNNTLIFTANPIQFIGSPIDELYIDSSIILAESLKELIKSTQSNDGIVIYFQ